MADDILAMAARRAADAALEATEAARAAAAAAGRAAAAASDFMLLLEDAGIDYEGSGSGGASSASGHAIARLHEARVVLEASAEAGLVARPRSRSTRRVVRPRGTAAMDDVGGMGEGKGTGSFRGRGC